MIYCCFDGRLVLSKNNIFLCHNVSIFMDVWMGGPMRQKNQMYGRSLGTGCMMCVKILCHEVDERSIYYVRSMSSNNDMFGYCGFDKK